jgi:DNA-binding transcriptional LysR family regulator
VSREAYAVCMAWRGVLCVAWCAGVIPCTLCPSLTDSRPALHCTGIIPALPPGVLVSSSLKHCSSEHHPHQLHTRLHPVAAPRRQSTWAGCTPKAPQLQHQHQKPLHLYSACMRRAVRATAGVSCTPLCTWHPGTSGRLLRSCAAPIISLLACRRANPDGHWACHYAY